MLIEPLTGQTNTDRFRVGARNDENICQNDRGKKAAYTLAEVLITLGIIGVVAALTIPSLMASYQKKQTATRLKSAYSQLLQAIKLSEAENDDIANWDFKTNGWFDKYLANYLKVNKSRFKNINEKDSIPYKQISGAREVGLWLIRGGNSSIYTLLNGVDLIVQNDSYNGSGIPDIAVDVNGVFTKPNQFGKDTFFFSISKTHGLYPYGIYTTSECTPPIEVHPGREYLKTASCFSYGCNKKGRGMYCAALIMEDGWEIRSDYPW